MPKRRRERDRPKTAPDSPYDLNKRAMLSYSSNDETNELAYSQGEETEFADYEIPPYPEEDNEYDDEYEPHDPERQQRDSPTYELPQRPEVKNINFSIKGIDKSRGAQGGNFVPKKNPETNQRPALGSLSFQFAAEDEAEDEDAARDESYPTTNEAMDYIRSVRAERRGIPFILTAHPIHVGDERDDDGGINDETQQHSGAEEYRDDEASDVVMASQDDPGNAAVDAQDRYNENLVIFFLQERDYLQQPPTAEAVAALDAAHPISFPPYNNKAVTDWLRNLSDKAPLPAQVRALDQDTVYELLDLICRRVLKKAGNVNPATSAWIWSLLARLQDVGGMNNDEVFPLRQLARRAMFVHFSFTRPDVAAQLEASLDQGETPEAPTVPETDEIPLDDDLAVLDRDFSEPTTVDVPRVAPSSTVTITDNTSATLYMIITIVGEVFRQRDLLELRPSWTPPITET